MEERMISPEPTVRRPSADLSERELERIKAFIQGAVYSYCKNCKGESFSASTLFGGDNYYWQGTPLEVVYERHIEDDDPVNRAGIDVGWILLDVLVSDKRHFNKKSGYVNEYNWLFEQSTEN
jgi:hypothetical protein